MNVVFLTLDYPNNDNQTNLYTDLMEEFNKNGHRVTVICPAEKRFQQSTGMYSHNSIPVLRVRTGNITQSKLIEKGISTLLIENQFIKAIKKYFSDNNVDLILYSTPPITFEKVIKFFKKNYKSTSYLLLKDIFPQNAVDIGMIKKYGPLHLYFKNKEKKLYEISDYIGCMSERNLTYLIEHNPSLNKEKIEVNPNSVKPINLYDLEEKNKIRKEMGIPNDALLFIYGGNLGKPQGIDFLVKSMSLYHNHKDIFFLIIGAGTEYSKIQSYINKNKSANIQLMSKLPKTKYDQLVRSADVGLIYLDKRFTIPNIPSRLLGYMNSSKPTLAVTDVNTDLKNIIREANCGYYTPAGDEEMFIKTMERIKKEKDQLEELGLNGRKYLEKNFHVSNSYHIINQHFVEGVEEIVQK